LHTGQYGHCGLNRQEADQQKHREFDAPFHPVILKIGVWFVPVCVLDHIECGRRAHLAGILRYAMRLRSYCGKTSIPVTVA
jgi:hypothetical protein